MLNFLLYLSTTLIWGSTWLAIKLQLTQVPPILSVGYRFFLAALILLVFCLLQKRPLRFSRHDHFFMALQGATLFGLAYCMSYLATLYLTSGLVAVVFSTILMWNILNLKLFMSQPVAWRAFTGGLAGLAGIGIIFWHDLTAFTATSGLIGLLIALSGAYLASVGNIIGSRNTKNGLPVTQSNAYGMMYGSLLTLIIHFGSGGDLMMDWSLSYLGPMLYLTLFGSIAAFGCYILLISRIGAEYAAYVMLIVPVIALFLSTIFENYQWSTMAVIGLILVMLGNVVILMQPHTTHKILRRLAL